jgi:hypothetical protein
VRDEDESREYFEEFLEAWKAHDMGEVAERIEAAQRERARRRWSERAKAWFVELWRKRKGVSK